MLNEDLKQAVTNIVPEAAFDEASEFLTATINGADLRPLMDRLRYDRELEMDYLFCLTCIDWKDHFMMTYHLLSKKHKHTLVVKAKLTDVAAPTIATVTDIWKTAIFHEREVYDLFGVRFDGHPDMRRIFLDEDWDGYPLRKNYVDENMIEI